MTLDAGINAVRTGRAAVMMGIDTVSLRDDEMRFAGLAPVSLICVASTSLDLQMEIKTTGRFSMARIPLNEFSRKHRIICVSDGPDKVPSPRMYGDLIIPSLSMSSAIFCNSVAEAYALARAHVGVAAVPDFAMLPEPGLRFFDIEESPASVYGAYYRSHDIHARKYVEFAQAAYAS